MASFNGRSDALSFDPSTGLSDGTNLIPTTQIISLASSTEKDEYTLFHASSSTSTLQKTSLLAPPTPLVSRYHLTALPQHLNPAVVDISIVVSAGSGTGQALTYLNDVVQPLLAEYGLPGDLYTVHITKSIDSIHEIAVNLSNAAKKRKQSVIILSGDTLIFEFLNSLPPPSEQERPILSLLPLGTGNALSASLSKSSPPLSTLLFGTPHQLPSFKATFSQGAQFILPDSTGKKPLHSDGVVRGSVVLSWGFHASLVADSDTAEFRKRGAERFKLAAMENLLPEPHGYKGTVSILPVGEKDWVSLSVDKPHFYTLATMVSNLEETFCISPASKPLAGGLHIVHFPVLPPEEVMRIMGLAYAGGVHVQDPLVRYENVQGIRIEVGEEEECWRRVCIDGAIVAVPEGGWVEVSVGLGVVDVVFRE